FKIIAASAEKEPLYQLWHTLYSIQDPEECRNALIKRFNIDVQLAERMSMEIDFTRSSFGNKSAKAIRKLLPHLMDGLGFSQAAEQAGYDHTNPAKEKRERTVHKDRLPLLSRNSLRQPVVERILNQTINV